MNGNKGCIIETSGCVIDNRPVTICDDGLNLWEATNVENEKNAICFSKAIENSFTRLINEELDNLTLFDFQANRELLLIGSEKTYIYNYGNGTWYIYDYLSGKHHSAFGNKIYYAKGFDLFVFSNELTKNYQNLCYWKSPFISSNQGEGFFDINELTADIYVDGESTIKFSLEKSGGGTVVTRTYKFQENDCKYLRVSFRPNMKRVVPFRISIECNGKGDYAIHGITIKTREKERSRRIGLL